MMQPNLEDGSAETSFCYKSNNDFIDYSTSTLPLLVPSQNSGCGPMTTGDDYGSTLSYQKSFGLDLFPSLNASALQQLDGNYWFPYSDAKTAVNTSHQAESSLYAPSVNMQNNDNEISGLSMKQFIDWLQVASSARPNYPYSDTHDNNALQSSSFDLAFGQDLFSPGESTSSLLSPTSFVSTMTSETTFADEVKTPDSHCNRHSPLVPRYSITNNISLSRVNQYLSFDTDIAYPQYTLYPSSSPPAEDFSSSQAVMIPRQQRDKCRGKDDLYTPRWVRGENLNREGWCSYCKPGCWLNLKTSQYHYHLQHVHGICQVTGRVCDPPLQLRNLENGAHLIDGLCGNCQEWITIWTARRRKNFSSWFDHARKCHEKPETHKLSRVRAVTPSSTSSTLSISAPIDTQSVVKKHHRSQSCIVQDKPILKGSTSHKRGAESISLPTDKKLRQL